MALGNLKIRKGDMLDLKVDAIVAPTSLAVKLEGEVGKSIKKRGNDRLLEAQMDQLSYLKITKTAIIKAYGLDASANYIIFVANPNLIEGDSEEMDQLKKSYINSVETAVEYDLRSISFPLLSSGNYHFKKSTAIIIAMSALEKCAKEHPSIQINLFIYRANDYYNNKELFKDYELLGGKFADDNDICYRERNEQNKWYRRKLTIEENRMAFVDKFNTYIACALNVTREEQKRGITKKLESQLYDGIMTKKSFINIKEGKTIPDKYTLISLIINMKLKDTIKAIRDLTQQINQPFNENFYYEDGVIYDCLAGDDLSDPYTEVMYINDELEKRGYKRVLKEI